MKFLFDKNITLKFGHVHNLIPALAAVCWSQHTLLIYLFNYLFIY